MRESRGESNESNESSLVNHPIPGPAAVPLPIPSSSAAAGSLSHAPEDGVSASPVSDLDRVLALPLPATLADCEQRVELSLRAGRMLSADVARCVAHALAAYPQFQGTGGHKRWSAWCARHLDIVPRHAEQYLAAGRLLLSHDSLTGKLSRLDLYKLEMLSWLEPDQVPALVEHTDLGGMSRDEMREKLKRMRFPTAADGAESAGPMQKGCNGSAKTQTPVPLLSDYLSDLVSTASDEGRRDRLVANADIPALNAAVGGLVLVDVAVRKICGQDRPRMEALDEILDELAKQTEAVTAAKAQILRRLLPGNGTDTAAEG